MKITGRHTGRPLQEDGGGYVISSEVIRGYIDLMILCVLCTGESYGYEIGKSIREITEGEYIIKETTLYSAFARMEKAGLIESFPGSVTHGKPRTYYRITERGREFREEKREEWAFTKKIISKFIEMENKNGND
ncbi:MAG: PadR family transcriptional regulator [Oscillospiraceae bacterium]|nr:PadR family transcriptional regulator [Oscillospiraceae bacterium]